MKKFSLLFFAIFSLLFFASCGGDESEAGEAETTEDNVAITIRAADGQCTGMELVECLSNQISAMSFQITDGSGQVIYRKSFERNAIGKNMKIDGIKDAENATLTVAVFGMKDGAADLNTVKWQAKVTGLRFAKGEKTAVDLLLYPTEKSNKEITMPEGLNIPRFGHSATLLADRRILVAGGFTACYSTGKCAATKSVEIIDLESGKIEQLADMNEERAMHEAILLDDGSVVFFGGVHGLNTKAEEYDKFPHLPYIPATPATTVEQYMPPYPKHNMDINGFGYPTANTSVSLSPAEALPFMPFQSYHTEKVSDTQTTVYMAGGIDSGTPSGKIYSFDITTADGDDGLTVTVSGAKEIAETDPMLFPIVAFSGGKVFTAGGRQNDSAVPASLDDEEWTAENLSNLFYTKNVIENGKLYTFGGYKNNGTELVGDKKIRKWDIGSKSITTAAENGQIRSYNSVVFPEVVYDQKNNQFIVIGGTGGEASEKLALDFYQVVNAETMELYGGSPSHRMAHGRIMPKAVIVPAGIIGEYPVLFIIGGTTELDTNGKAVPQIEIHNL